MADGGKIYVYDTTLRDGLQSDDVSLTVDDRLAIAARLDEMGFDYIEGGWPGSNQRDAEFFTRAAKLRLRHAKLCAFGATRRARIKASQDRSLALLLRAGTPVATVVGKTSELHVREALRISLQENLDILGDTVRYLKQHVDEVILDAEHFFDGFAQNPQFTLSCIKAAAQAGADLVCLCDTNGGRLPEEIAQAVARARETLPCGVGIHCHNDSDVAVANTVAAVRAGARQVQGTINGLGERCGNANLISVIANLQLKMGYQCLPAAKLKHLRQLSTLVNELANLTPMTRQPYVGRSAFAHKGGLHVSAVQRNTATYEHIDPALVGNDRRVLLSELAGQSNIVYKAREFGLELKPDDERISGLLAELKRLEAAGYAYDGADASFELVMLRALGLEREHFGLVSFRVFDDKWNAEQAPFSEAIVIIDGPDGRRTRSAATGNGPVNALDSALRAALIPYYPTLGAMRLADYKVRVLDNGAGTGARVRVLIESTDGKRRWTTVGVSANVIEASWQALIDSVEYKLHRDRAQPKLRAAASMRAFKRKAVVSNGRAHAGNLNGARTVVTKSDVLERRPG
ncbi:MAG TPA: citramalate synthase [Candidatus Binataceae bacterium]|nr:citramalate synthase [Candidatus Binataceae bacterium]